MGSHSSLVSVYWNGDSRRNIILWMDHRALDQAERINSHNSPILQFNGGSVSPEMQAPKIRLYFLGSMAVAPNQTTASAGVLCDLGHRRQVRPPPPLKAAPAHHHINAEATWIREHMERHLQRRCQRLSSADPPVGYL
ncbi:uncharacterized protein [Triticum aestivum]|uniref:uncharacterized protein n=1 Tax=Triticum aestivum TaxID=4565 RepID=UPI001D00D14F|nr:uncharacterized protein LOC123159857 [Triticum aestivum]XP_044433607.1 uncharacterized protein LOC123159859 [Triticum aestivum]